MFSKIWVGDPGSELWDLKETCLGPESGSRGQKSTGSRFATVTTNTNLPNLVELCFSFEEIAVVEHLEYGVLRHEGVGVHVLFCKGGGGLSTQLFSRVQRS
jgi:hypothetical protein